MAGFLKILLRNVLEGPSTDPFPLGETFTPKRFRGKVVLNPDLCMGCGICRHTCAAGAINIHVRPDQSGYDFTVWHNSCCLCASCRHYCPTGAITLSNDWHNAHTQEEKFTWLEQKFVPYIPCAGCGTPMRPTPLSIAKKIYINNKDVDLEQVIKLCPKCRQIEDARKHTTPLPQTAEEVTEGNEAPKADAKAKAAPAAAAPVEPKEEVQAPAPKTESPKVEAKPETQADEKAEAQPAAPVQTPEAVLEKTLAEPVPQPETKPEPKVADKLDSAAPVTAAKPAEKAEDKPVAKTAPKPDDKPKAANKPASAPARTAAPAPAPAPAPAKSKGKAKGKKTK